MRKGIRNVNKKRGLAVLLSACMAFGMAPIQAKAEDTGFGIETQTKAAELGDDVYAKESTESNSWLEVSSAENKYLPFQNCVFLNLTV